MTIRAARQDTTPGRLQRWRIGLLEAGQVEPLPPETLTRLGVAGLGYQAYEQGAPVANTFDPCTATANIGLDEGTEQSRNAWPVSVGEECITLDDQDGTAASARAVARLRAQSSHLAEYTFWTGNIGTSGDTFTSLTWPNRALASNVAAVTNLTPLAPLGVVAGFSAAMRHLADNLGGLRGVIHIPVDLLPYASYYDVVIRDGFTLGTALGDHLVIAGSGYPGTAPDGTAAAAGTVWMYATGMVRAGATPIVTNSAVDRETNKSQAIATRTVLAEWDQQVHAAVQICLPDPGPACP